MTTHMPSLQYFSYLLDKQTARTKTQTSPTFLEAISEFSFLSYSPRNENSNFLGIEDQIRTKKFEEKSQFRVLVFALYQKTKIWLSRIRRQIRAKSLRKSQSSVLSVRESCSLNIFSIDRAVR